jgi:hypothetical protein
MVIERDSIALVTFMGIGTLLGFLIGNRAAILKLATHPHAWLVGLLFVLSAGFAREYDGEDLLHEPWHLLLPLAASLVSSFFLYCILYGISTYWRQDGPSFFSGYRSFLSLFWLTAPLAWLYAIPYERFLQPLDATHTNLATLALVSVWRVALMIRVAVVLMGMPFWRALVRVLAYADGVALLAIYFLPFHLLEFMGGVRLTESESAVRNTAGTVCCWSGVAFPILFLFTVLDALEGQKGTWQISTSMNATPQGVSWPLGILTFLSLTIWIGVLPFTQPEQQLSREVDIAFREGRIADGVAIMSAHSREDFPPHWTPPPRYLKGEHLSQIFDVWDEFLHAEPAPWVREMYLVKLKSYIRMKYVDVIRFGNLLDRMPTDQALELVNDMNSDQSTLWLRQGMWMRPELREKVKIDN